MPQTTARFLILVKMGQKGRAGFEWKTIKLGFFILAFSRTQERLP
jgi:hypothetical protein